MVSLGYHGGFMLLWAALILIVLGLCSCKPAEEGHMKAIIGAVLIDGLGGPPVSNSVVVVSGKRKSITGLALSIPNGASNARW